MNRMPLNRTFLKKDETPVQALQIGNQTAFLFEKLGVQGAMCQDRNTIYSLADNLTRPVVADIFDSIPIP